MAQDHQPPAIITLTTDFGPGSRYVGAMKGVILSINPRATIVDLSHAVPARDIRAGAVALAETATWFPPGSIHVAVVDPGVGSKRRIVYAQIGEQHFVAPDNGLLTFPLRHLPPARAIRLTEKAARYTRQPVSATFHGRIYFMRRQMQSRGRRTSTDYADYTDYLLESEVECLSYSVFIRNSNGQHDYLKIICVILRNLWMSFFCFWRRASERGKGLLPRV